MRINRTALALLVVFFALACWRLFVYRPVALDKVPTSPFIQGSDSQVVLDSPREGERIVSPLKVTGRARGTWFFEASFPILLTDWDGRIIAESHVTATDEWMTTDWVPFEGTIEFTPDTSVSSRGALILKKDNPSGDPVHDDARERTVFYK